MRKLCLTSILALISPGSAGQVVSGLLIAFFMLVLNLRLKPWSNDDLNFINSVAQVNLFFLLLVALLLKVNLDGTADSRYFSFIVGFMCIVRPPCIPWAARPLVCANTTLGCLQVPIALPIFIKQWLKMYGNMQSRLSVKDTAWSSK